MAYSSILGGETAPQIPSGRDAERLGPSDSSDSGSDALYSDELHADSDAAGTGERGSAAAGEGREGADILPDRVVQARGEDALGDEVVDAPEDPLSSGAGFPAADIDAREYTDLDADPDAEIAPDEAER